MWIKRWAIAAFLSLCLCGAAAAATVDPEAVLLDELVVRAKLPGPAWWVVRNGGSKVYVMAVPEFAPPDVPFETSVLERRLQAADRLILPPELEAHPLRLTRLALSQVRRASAQPAQQPLPPDLSRRLHARLAAVDENPNEMDNVRPAFAGFFVAYVDSPKSSLQADTVARRIEALARRSPHRPHIVRVDGYDLASWAEALLDLPPEQQRACLEAGLGQAERGRSGAVAVAQFWATGDSGAYAHADRGFDACFAATPQIADQIRRGIDSSTRAIEDALKRPGPSVALVHFRPLLARDGVLDRLRRSGYEVTTPDT